MNNPTLYLVGGIFLILFFCVMVYFFTKTFRALHVVFLFLTFSMAMWFLVMASLSHKTRLHWREQVDRLSQELEQIEGETDQLVNNFQVDAEGNRAETVTSFRSKLNRVLLDRGRIWRGATVASVSPASEIQVNTSPAGAAEIVPNQLAPNDIVYAFLEGDGGAGFKVPVNYLGEFRATAATDSSVTLTPVDARLLFPSQTNMINNSAGNAGVTWTLYEIMPIDSHKIYSVDPSEDVALSAVEGQRIFGEMAADVVNTLYNPDNFIAEFVANLNATDPQQRQSLLQRLDTIRQNILRDGGAPLRGGAGAGGAVDPPENIYTKVQFEQDYTVEVDSDSGQGALTSNYYDSQGRAVVDRLRRKELGFLDENEQTTEVTFKQGDFAVFHKEKADELIEQNIVKPIEPRFVRTLIDFTYEFHKILDRQTRVAQDIQRLNSEIAKTRAADERTKRQRDFRQMEKDKLLVDKSKFDTERDRVTAYADQLRQKMDRLKGELSVLYRSNAALAARLAAKSEALAEEINSRTEAAGEAAAAGASGG